MTAVIYARYSSDNQTENSIEGQLREYMEYADKHNMQVVGEYIDRALSAKTDNRPQFQRVFIPTVISLCEKTACCGS